MTKNSATDPKLAAKKLGLGGVLSLGGMAMNIAMPILEYNQSRKEGNNAGISALKAAGSFLAWEVAAPVMWGAMAFEVGTALYEAGSVIGKKNTSYVSNAFKGQFGGNYIDSQNAANMRRAGQYNIEYSKQNIQQTLGNEAKSYSRRSYYRRDT